MRVIITRRESGDGFDISTDLPDRRPDVHCTTLDQATTYANGLVDGWNQCRQSLESASWHTASFVLAAQGGLA